MTHERRASDLGDLRDLWEAEGGLMTFEGPGGPEGPVGVTESNEKKRKKRGEVRDGDV